MNQENNLNIAKDNTQLGKTKLSRLPVIEPFRYPTTWWKY